MMIFLTIESKIDQYSRKFNDTFREYWFSQLLFKLLLKKKSEMISDYFFLATCTFNCLPLIVRFFIA